MNNSDVPTDANFTIGSFRSVELKQHDEFCGYLTDIIDGKITEIDCLPPQPISINRNFVPRKGDTISLGYLAFWLLCQHCYAMGEKTVYIQIDTAYRKGDIKTIEDVIKMTEIPHNLFNDERNKRWLLEQQTKPQKRRRGYVPTEAELKDAHKKSNSWVQMAKSLTTKSRRKITDKTVKDLWKEYCLKKNLPFSEKFSE
jgi:hypothetical protein